MKHYNNMKNLVVAVLTVAALQTMAALSTGAKVQPQNSAPKEVKSAAALFAARSRARVGAPAGTLLRR